MKAILTVLALTTGIMTAAPQAHADQAKEALRADLQSKILGCVIVYNEVINSGVSDERRFKLQDKVNFLRQEYFVLTPGLKTDDFDEAYYQTYKSLKTKPEFQNSLDKLENFCDAKSSDWIGQGLRAGLL